MDKVAKASSVIAMLLIACSLCSQMTVNPGLVRAQLTLSPAYRFADSQSYLYLHGNIEYYLSETLSLSGEGYYYLGSMDGQNQFLDMNHSTFFGASYHLTKDNHDLYFGIQPGVSITKVSAVQTEISSSSVGVSPLFSPVLGYNLFVHEWFHFFIQSRLVLGEHNHDLHTSLTDVRISAGLGFNLSNLKRKSNE